MSELNYFQQKKRNEAILWARSILDNKDKYVIMDTETTGLKDDDVIIHFAVMDLNRNMLIDSFVKPMSKRRISKDAEYVHGIKIKDLVDAPLFEEVVEPFRPIALEKTIVSFNAYFHARMFESTYYNEGCDGDLIRLNVEDVQERYGDFIGRSGYAALPGRKNTGVGDCNATLNVILKMANSETVDVLATNKPDNLESADPGVILLITSILTAIGIGAFSGKWGWSLFVLMIGTFIFMGTNRKTDL